MTTQAAAANKAKIARRVIEVLDYFDDLHREATVMDIVRRYGRPQSSTSELLSSLVELGLLTKDAHARSYSLTPRAALIGAAAQPEAIRDGRLVRMLDRLSAQTGLGTGLFAISGVNAQLISWRCASSGRSGPYNGSQEPLCHSAAGWLLLSTIDRSRRDGILRRLNAEASDAAKFVHAELAERIEAAACDGHVTGPAGFGSPGEALAVLLPAEIAGQPLAVSIFHEDGKSINAPSLLQSARDAIERCMADPKPAELAEFPTAA
jgi:DNA-binding IclR family transcriptional regulator